MQNEKIAASSFDGFFFMAAASIKLLFIIPPGMDRHYSTLELVRYDETARAPERDHDATAFELDASVSAPQVSRNCCVARGYINWRYRLCLIQLHKCCTIPHFLRPAKSPPKNAFPVITSSRILSNGR